MNANQSPQPSPHRVSLAQRARPRPELWLYDEVHARTIRDSGVIDPYDPLAATKYRALAKQGVMVGYHLGASQSVVVSLWVGESRSAEQLSVLQRGRWHAPATALLDAPSGRLCIESRDRLMAQPPDADTEPSGVLTVMPGRYRLTLYVSMWYANQSENMASSGRHQIIVLSRGGTETDAVDHVLMR